MNETKPEPMVAAVAQMRPRLHRYCSRMVGSAVDGEDLVQDTVLKALAALDVGTRVDRLEPWLYGIARHTCIDFLRARQHAREEPLVDDVEAEALPDAALLSLGFRTFLRLPELQRCAVILKDVLGHSVDEIAEIAECTSAAAKSALQRGRAGLQALACAPSEAQSDRELSADHAQLAAYVEHFRNGEFDRIRAMLADDVRLDLANRLRLRGRAQVDPYFTRYAQETRWRFASGHIEDRPAILVFDRQGSEAEPSHFALIEFHDGKIVSIKDYLFAPYVLEGVKWRREGFAALSDRPQPD